MEELFYIIEDSQDWYQLRVLPSHFCIACGPDFDKLVDTIRRYITNYKSAQGVHKALSYLDRGEKVNPITKERREKEYKAKGDIYRDIIKEAIVEQYTKNNKQTLYQKIKSNKLVPCIENNEPKKQLPKIAPKVQKRINVQPKQRNEFALKEKKVYNAPKEQTKKKVSKVQTTKVVPTIQNGPKVFSTFKITI